MTAMIVKMQVRRSLIIAKKPTQNRSGSGDLFDVEGFLASLGIKLIKCIIKGSRLQKKAQNGSKMDGGSGSRRLGSPYMALNQIARVIISKNFLRKRDNTISKIFF